MNWKNFSLVPILAWAVIMTLVACDGNNRPPAYSSSSPSSGSGASGTELRPINHPFKSEQSPPFWYIHLDTSGSMSGGRLETAKQAILEFLDKAPKDLVFGLACFDGNGGTIEMVPFCENSRELIKYVLPGIGPGGGTPLGSAIRFSTKKLHEQEVRQFGHGQFNLLVVTDGVADDLPDMDSAVQEMEKPGKYGAPVNLYTIAFQLPSTHSLAAKSVKYLEADDKEGLVAAFAEATRSELQSIEDLLDLGK